MTAQVYTNWANGDGYWPASFDADEAGFIRNVGELWPRVEEGKRRDG